MLRKRRFKKGQEIRALSEISEGDYVVHASHGIGRFKGIRKLEMEGITKGVSLRTIQGDIQMMRSDKLGYNAPIEVYDLKYYRYSDPDYTITGMPLSSNDVDVL